MKRSEFGRNVSSLGVNLRPELQMMSLLGKSAQQRREITTYASQKNTNKDRTDRFTVRGGLRFFRLMRGEDRGSCCAALPAGRFISSLRLAGFVGNLQQEVIHFSPGLMFVITALVPSFCSSLIQRRLVLGGLGVITSRSSAVGSNGIGFP